MGEFQATGAEIKAFVKVMRKRPVSFAFNPGADTSKDYLALHKTKPPKMLGKDAKESGAGSKSAFGTAQVEGKVLSLTCDRELPALAKKVKKYLKSQKVTLNVQVLDGSGNILDADIEDLADDPELNHDAGAAGPSEQVAKRVFLLERWKKIPGELNAEIATLNQRVAANVPQEDPDDFCQGVEEWFSSLVAELQSELDDAINLSVNAGDDSYSAVAEVISKKLRPRVANDKLVLLFKKGKLVSGNPFEDSFNKAFSEIESALTA